MRPSPNLPTTWPPQPDEQPIQTVVTAQLLQLGRCSLSPAVLLPLKLSTRSFRSPRRGLRAALTLAIGVGYKALSPIRCPPSVREDSTVLMPLQPTAVKPREAWLCRITALVLLLV